MWCGVIYVLCMLYGMMCVCVCGVMCIMSDVCFMVWGVSVCVRTVVYVMCDVCFMV